MAWKCPKGCQITQGVVCGGDTPWHNHGEKREAGNVYFLVGLATSESLRQAVTELPFDLTEQDWTEMESHADGGCCAEPQCPECLEFLELA